MLPLIFQVMCYITVKSFKLKMSYAMQNDSGGSEKIEGGGLETGTTHASGFVEIRHGVRKIFRATTFFGYSFFLLCFFISSPI